MKKRCQLSRVLLLLMCFYFGYSLATPCHAKSGNHLTRKQVFVPVHRTAVDNPMELRNDDHYLDEEKENSFDSSAKGLTTDKLVRVKRSSPNNRGIIDSNNLLISRSLKEAKENVVSDQDPMALPSREDSKYEDKSYEVRGQITDDSEKFIDQQDRSQMYDDFEAKDVVKRGISSADDYEEVDESEDFSGIVENTVQAADANSEKEPGEGNEASSETRIKRAESNSEKLKDESNGLEEENLEAKNDDSKVFEDGLSSNLELDQNTLQDDSEGIAEKEQKENEPVASKRSVVEEGQPSAIVEGEVSQSAKDSKPIEAESADSGEAVAELSRLRDIRKPSIQKTAESPRYDSDGKNELILSVEAHPQDDESKQEQVIDGNVNNNDADPYSAYEQRAVAEIQRKIESIKEEIKRQIDEKQRIREIQANNAKFDELRVEESQYENEKRRSRSTKTEKRQIVSKRSPKRSRESSHAEDRKKLKKRSPAKIEQHRQNRSNRKKKPKPNKAKPKKRSVRNSISTKISTPIKKRDYARQVILVDNAEDAKKRKRRSKNAEGKSRGNLRAQRSANAQSRSSLIDADEQTGEVDVVSPMLGRRAESIGSRAAAQEGIPRLADYNEAFGGLQSEPGVALARFKRIKRAVRVPT